MRFVRYWQLIVLVLVIGALQGLKNITIEVVFLKNKYKGKEVDISGKALLDATSDWK